MSTEQRPRSSILVVDDDIAVREILEYILGQNYLVLTAGSGKDALEIAKEKRPDLILLDIIMPDISGFDLLLEFKESDATRNIPVIFITGLDSIEDEETGFFLGAVDYIAKPVRESIVRARVSTHIQIVNQIRTIERLGMIDALTEIPNRRSFDEKMQAEWSRCLRDKKPLSLVMIDVDKFKVYNDTYGHPQGDALLRTVAKVLAKTLKRPADMAARWGGEEFAALLPATPLEGAIAIAEMIRKNIQSTVIPLEKSNTPTSVTASLGVASIIPVTENSLKDLTTAADNFCTPPSNRGATGCAPRPSEATFIVSTRFGFLSGFS